MENPWVVIRAASADRQSNKLFIGLIFNSDRAENITLMFRASDFRLYSDKGLTLKTSCSHSLLFRHSLDTLCSLPPPRTSAEAKTFMWGRGRLRDESNRVCVEGYKNATLTYKRALTRRLIRLFEIISSSLKWFKQPRKHGHRKTPRVIPAKMKEHSKFQDQKTHSHSEISFLLCVHSCLCPVCVWLRSPWVL